MQLRQQTKYVEFIPSNAVEYRVEYLSNWKNLYQSDLEKPVSPLYQCLLLNCQIINRKGIGLAQTFGIEKFSASQ